MMKPTLLALLLLFGRFGCGDSGETPDDDTDDMTDDTDDMTDDSDMDGGSNPDGGAPPDGGEPPEEFPEVDISACDGTIPNDHWVNGPVDDDITLSGGVYYIGGDLDLMGYTLTIEAGTLVCMGNTVSISGGNDGGVIRIMGTESERVVLAAASDDFWDGLDFRRPAENDMNEIHYADLVNAGRSAPAILDQPFEPSEEDDPDSEPLLLDQVRIIRPVQRGLEIYGRYGLDEDSVVEIWGTYEDFGGEKYPYVEVEAFAAQTITDDTVSFHDDIPFSSNAIYVNADDDYIEGDVGFLHTSIPFRIAQFWFRKGTFTIAAGATVQLADEASIIMGQTFTDGTDTVLLIADGTASQRITFTTADDPDEAAAEDREVETWGNVFFQNDFDRSGSIFDYVNFEYSRGGTASQSVCNCEDFGDVLCTSGTKFGVIAIDSPPSNSDWVNGDAEYEGPTITNVTFEHISVAGTDHTDEEDMFAIAFHCRAGGMCIASSYEGMGNTVPGNDFVLQTPAACE